MRGAEISEDHSVVRIPGQCWGGGTQLRYQYVSVGTEHLAGAEYYDPDAALRQDDWPDQGGVVLWAGCHLGG